jgi:macrolide-specific efflux system membrane fusion protein
MKRILLTGLAALLLAGCFLFPKEEEKLAPPLMEPPKITYETFAVKRATIVDDFRVNANFRYTQEESLYFHRGGRLLKSYVNSGDRVKSGQLLAELDADTLKYDVASQEITVQKAHLVADHTAALGRDRYEQQLAALDVKQSELTLANDKAELAKAQLFSPLDGVVDYVGAYAEGDSIDAYRTVLRVADPRVIELVYEGERTSDLTFGATVEVTYKDRVYTGAVTRSTKTAPVTASDAEKGYDIIHVKGLSASVQSGDSASIRVIVQRRDNVLVIPRNLVQTYQGANYVDVLKGGVRRQVPVEQGIVTMTDAEIINGLSEGDQVIIR